MMKSGKSQTRPTILVVDDEANIRKLVAVNLTSRGYRVVEASTGAEALTLLDNESPVLMILDIKLPDFTGWDLLDRLLTSTHLKSQVPVLVMTASILDAQIDLANYPTVTRILIKPFSMLTFISAVELSLHKVR